MRGLYVYELGSWHIGSDGTRYGEPTYLLDHRVENELPNIDDPTEGIVWVDSDDKDPHAIVHAERTVKPIFVLPLGELITCYLKGKTISGAGTLNVQVQTSDDDSNWYPIVTFVQVVATSLQAINFEGTPLNAIRARVVAAGGWTGYVEVKLASSVQGR